MSENNEDNIRSIAAAAARRASAAEKHKPPADLTAAVEGRKRAEKELNQQND